MSPSLSSFFPSFFTSPSSPYLVPPSVTLRSPKHPYYHYHILSKWSISRILLSCLFFTTLLWLTILIFGTHPKSSSTTSDDTSISSSLIIPKVDPMTFVPLGSAEQHQTDANDDGLDVILPVASFRAGILPPRAVPASSPIHRLTTTTLRPSLPLIDDHAPIRVLDELTFQLSEHDNNVIIMYMMIDENTEWVDAMSRSIEKLEAMMLKDIQYPVAIFHLSLSREIMRHFQSLTTSTIHFIKLQFQLPESMSSLPDIDTLISIETSHTHHGVPFMSSHLERFRAGFGFQLSIFDDYEYVMIIDPMLICNDAATWDHVDEMSSQHIHYGTWTHPKVMSTGVDELLSATLNFIEIYRLNPTFLYDRSLITAAEQRQQQESMTEIPTTSTSSIEKRPKYRPGRAGIHYSNPHKLKERIVTRVHEHGDELLKTPIAGHATCCHNNPALQSIQSSPSNVPSSLRTDPILGYDLSYEIISLHMIRSGAVKRYLDHLDVLNGFYTHAWSASAVRYMTMATLVKPEQIRTLTLLEQHCKRKI